MQTPAQAAGLDIQRFSDVGSDLRAAFSAGDRGRCGDRIPKWRREAHKETVVFAIAEIGKCRGEY
jgi:hypothetical protein